VRTILLSFGLMLLTSGFMTAAEKTPVYELRIYTAAPGRLNDVLARFRDHTIAIFAKHGIVSVGYWVPVEAKDGAGEKLVYLLRYPSREEAKQYWAAFQADPAWLAAKQASEVTGKIVAKAESIFLEAADYSPAVAIGAGPGAPRVFELRTYTTPAGKLPALDARFRHPERGYFVRHGMMEIGYFHPLDTDKGAGQTLVYMLAHASRTAAAASWQGFRADPDWVALKAATEKNGPLTSKIESVFLAPTAFSPLR
jgi:hypothetical protein